MLSLPSLDVIILEGGKQFCIRYSQQRTLVCNAMFGGNAAQPFLAILKDFLSMIDKLSESTVNIDRSGLVLG
jgi:hypothetical protein